MNEFETLVAVAAKSNDVGALRALRNQDPERFDRHVKDVAGRLKLEKKAPEAPSIWSKATPVKKSKSDLKREQYMLDVAKKRKAGLNR